MSSAPIGVVAESIAETASALPRWHRDPSIWKGDKLDALRLAYEANEQKLETLAQDHGTHYSYIVKLAIKHGWRTRHPNKRHAQARI